MFRLEQPSMALNSPEVKHSKITMWNTWEVPMNTPREHIINWVSNVARGAPGGKLKNVVINCHGAAAYVQIGQGFGPSHTGMFTPWTGLVEKIWFVACLVARIPTSAMRADGITGDGNIFCSEIARNAQCHVVAPTEEQINRGGSNKGRYDIGVMPTFEGLLVSYSPNGEITWSHRYRSNWLFNRE